MSDEANERARRQWMERHLTPAEIERVLQSEAESKQRRDELRATMTFEQAIVIVLKFVDDCLTEYGDVEERVAAEIVKSNLTAITLNETKKPE